MPSHQKRASIILIKLCQHNWDKPIVISVIVSSILFGLTIGFSCGYFSQKHKQSSNGISENVAVYSQPHYPTVLYEDVLPNFMGYQEQDLELKQDTYGL